MTPLCLIRDRDDRFEGLPLVVEYIDGIKWKLERSISYRIASGAFDDCVSTAQAGFVFDFASIPRFFWRILPPAGLSSNPYGIAALFHDWLYKHHAIMGTPCTRAQADALFYELMLYVGCRPVSSWLMYRSVRAFGWIAWHRGGDDQSADQEVAFA